MRQDVFKELLELNQAFEQVIHGLESMEKIPFFQAESLRYARAEVETARVDANREFFDHFVEIVENEARWVYKFRREHDRATQDPFDFYLEVREREEARKKKGLPPRAVLLPGWDEDDENGDQIRKSPRRTKVVPVRPRNRLSTRKAARKRDK